ncbi:hypothetical protein GobsT_02080 [Gemmata obscuriglobus]|uniref:Secreted protein n=1 Tax=Gemmata obscuriglobus TaxID=114 RepID=A0A2Z3H8G7_9BACT|nr:hypothetical protein [Gemmata obscuriglobus]AWM41181.1 hypothetical protein C1280_32115 [Gemmata obscuriglobus]QEG25482.1 hypothetical protein GobsT_02080 [Gemmata obscuriglobus]VTR98711.1 unnamed protein product [Gemmata obscuriglobus UQM 2246]
MKRILIAVLVQVLVAGHVNAEWVKKSGTTVPTATVNPLSVTPAPAVGQLQPIVGSVRRTSHFTNPFTHKAKYSYGTYNPISGQFGTGVFRR